MVTTGIKTNCLPFFKQRNIWIHLSSTPGINQGEYGVPFSHLFTELQISPIEVHISPIQLQISTIDLQISTIQLEISPNRLNCRYLQLNCRYL